MGIRQFAGNGAELLMSLADIEAGPSNVRLPPKADIRTYPHSSAAPVSRLHILMRERIDELNGKLEQLRDQNRRLDADNEHLVEMVRLPPPF